MRSGALLAIGLVNVGVKNECDPAMALLSDQVMAPSQNLRIGAILGLGLAYAASRRTDLNDLLMKPLVDKQSEFILSFFIRHALFFMFRNKLFFKYGKFINKIKMWQKMFSFLLLEKLIKIQQYTFRLSI